VAGPEVIPPHVSGLLLTSVFVSIAGGLIQFLSEVQEIVLDRFSEVREDFPLSGPSLL